MCCFNGNEKIIIYLFQIGFPNGLYITVSRCKVMIDILVVLVSEM